MSAWIDMKYIGSIAHRLEQFKTKKNDLYNFRCCYCGDSKKNKFKARGFLYRKNSDFFYICHNCGMSTTFGKFLKDLDATLYREYMYEKFSNKFEPAPTQKPKVDLDELKGSSAFLKFKDRKKRLSDIKATKINELPDSHYAVAYIKERKIPEKYWGEIFFASKFLDFLREEFPDIEKDEKELPNDDRIILFFTNEKGEITNISGRSLSGSKIRYVVVKVQENEKKVFGLHRIQPTERVYAFEGQFDSLFLPNSIASGDSNLGGLAAAYPDLKIVLVYDREPRNKELVKQIERSINKGYSVCLLPEELPGKDINEMIQNGLTCDELQRIIDKNTFADLSAKMHFSQWQKCNLKVGGGS